MLHISTFVELLKLQQKYLAAFRPFVAKPSCKDESDLLREALIKSGMQIAQTDFLSGGCRPQDCTKTTQEYLMYFKEFSCNQTENMQARCVPRFIQCFPNFWMCLLAV